MPILTPEERVGSTMAGKYRLDRILATGGMATVFGGTHAWTEREVAVKILNYEHARDPEVVRRFLQEARAAAQLKHPNVVDVLDMGEDTDGTVYLVLERLHGETLKARIKRGPLSLREVGQLILPVMRAVASAHAKNVVHRDLKPDNLYIATVEGGAIVPKLLDFGIAKVNAGDSGSTRTGLMVGTPSYMAPEQVRGERNVGPRADVWSMGVVLHAALTGRVPFEAESSAAVLARVITERAKPIALLAPALRPSVAAVVDRALMFEQEARFADMGEMVVALEAAIDGPVEPVRAAPAAVTDTPTLHQPLELPKSEPSDLDQVTSPAPPPRANAGLLPASTPFAWAPAPPSEPAPAPASRLPWILGAIAALLVAISGLAYGLRSEPEPVAAPIGPATPTSPAAAPRPSVPPAAAPRASAPAEAPSEPTHPTIVPLPAAPVAVSTSDPDAGAARTEEPAPSVATSTPATEPVRSTRGEPRSREPRRGTRGVLILH